MSQRLHRLVDEWTSMGYDFNGGERDADEAWAGVAATFEAVVGANAARRRKEA